MVTASSTRARLSWNRSTSADSATATARDDAFEDRHADLGFDSTRPTTDQDGDGLPDAVEASLGSAIDNPVSDADGWSDTDEWMNRAFGFDPVVASPDADFDGFDRRVRGDPRHIPQRGRHRRPTVGTISSNHRAGSDPLVADPPLLELSA
jgi:hypothetical protein